MQEEYDPFNSSAEDEAKHDAEVFTRMRQDAKDGKATKVNTLNPADKEEWRRKKEQDKSIPVTKQNESLDDNQKSAGQWGPTGRHAKKGDLVGTFESIDPLDELKRLLGK